MKKLLAVTAAIALVGAGALASTVVGQGKEDAAPLTDRPVIQGEVERASAAQARAAGVATRAKKKKGPKVSYYIQSAPTEVPAGEAADLIALGCPGKRKVIAGYFQSTGGVVSDYFSRSDQDFKTWLFGFVNLTVDPQQARGGIVCMTKV